MADDPVPDAPLARDGCVVPTEPLSHLLNGFVQQWKRTRPATRGRFRQRAEERATVDPLGAVEWLALKTREQDPTGRGIPEGTIQNIVSGGRYKHTELRVADPLIAAINMPEAFHGNPPVLPILPNPSASKEARASCCGGALTGDALG